MPAASTPAGRLCSAPQGSQQGYYSQAATPCMPWEHGHCSTSAQPRMAQVQGYWLECAPLHASGSRPQARGCKHTCWVAQPCMPGDTRTNRGTRWCSALLYICRGKGPKPAIHPRPFRPQLTGLPAMMAPLLGRALCSTPHITRCTPPHSTPPHPPHHSLPSCLVAHGTPPHHPYQASGSTPTPPPPGRFCAPMCKVCRGAGFWPGLPGRKLRQAQVGGYMPLCCSCMSQWVRKCSHSSQYCAKIGQPSTLPPTPCGNLLRSRPRMGRVL